MPLIKDLNADRSQSVTGHVAVPYDPRDDDEWIRCLEDVSRLAGANIGRIDGIAPAFDVVSRDDVTGAAWRIDTTVGTVLVMFREHDDSLWFDRDVLKPESAVPSSVSLGRPLRLNRTLETVKARWEHDRAGSERVHDVTTDSGWLSLLSRVMSKALGCAVQVTRSARVAERPCQTCDVIWDVVLATGHMMTASFSQPTGFMDITIDLSDDVNHILVSSHDPSKLDLCDLDARKRYEDVTKSFVASDGRSRSTHRSGTDVVIRHPAPRVTDVRHDHLKKRMRFAPRTMTRRH